MAIPCKERIAGVGNLRPASNCFSVRQTCRGKKSKVALPYVGQYHLPVNRSLDPHFDTNPKPNDAVVTTVHIQRPFFSKLDVKFQNFSRLRLHIENYCQLLP